MLNRNDVVPLYKQLQEELRKQIQSGELKPREKIPSEVNLAKQYNVSVITARKAVSELAKEELVEKKQGKGTFVTGQKYQRDLHQIISFSEFCRLNGAVAGGRLLECKLIDPDKKILQKLERPEGEQVLFISRLRYMNGEPMSIETNHFPISYSYLINENLDGNSLFDILKERSGTEVTISRRTLEICRATPQEARHLSVSRGSPLILIRSIAYSPKNQPVFVGSQLINGERYQFIV